MLAQMEEVSELQPVPDAHVPVMKFKFEGISVDLLYASISTLVVTEVSVDVFSALRFFNSFLRLRSFITITIILVLLGEYS